MAWSGGTFSRVMSWVTDAANAIKIRADRHDQEDDNLAAGINDCLHKGGQNSATADIDLGNNKIVNLDTPTNSGDAATKAYVDGLVPGGIPAVSAGVAYHLLGVTSAGTGYGLRTATAFTMTLLDDASAGAALTTLGFSTFMQTTVDDASAGTFRTTVGALGSSLARGGVFIGNASATATEVTVGSAGTILRSDGTDTVFGRIPYNVEYTALTSATTISLSADVFTTITGVSDSITIVSASSRVLIMIMLTGSTANVEASNVYQVLRDSTPIGIGDAASARFQATTGDGNSVGANFMRSMAIFLVDSPGAAGTYTYSIQVRPRGASTYYLNRTETDTDNADFPRGVSTVTLMEITP